MRSPGSVGPGVPYGTRHTPEMVADLARRAVARKTGARTKALLETV